MRCYTKMQIDTMDKDGVATQWLSDPILLVDNTFLVLEHVLVPALGAVADEPPSNSTGRTHQLFLILKLHFKQLLHSRHCRVSLSPP